MSITKPTMKLQPGLPKTLVAAVRRLEVRHPGSVYEAFSEGEDGYWVVLNEGWVNPSDGVHCVHEWRVAAALPKLASVRQCTCADCRARPEAAATATDNA